MSPDDLREGERLGPAPPVPEPAGVRSLLRLATVDIGPLRRHRDFRLLFVGQGVSAFGSMITYVALPYQAYQLSGSSLVVGLLSLAELVPLLVTAFVGGALADAFDRRRLVQIAELGLAACAGVLVFNSTLSEPRLWVLFAVGAAMAGLDGIQRPPLDALIPRLVDREEFLAASALDGFRSTFGWVAGPALAGVFIAVLGLPLTYTIDVATFGVSLVALALMRAVPPPPGADRPSLRGILEGLRYAKSRPELVGTYTVDLIAMFFGIPIALFPAFSEEFGGAGALGLLYAAPALGALIATATSGWTARDQPARDGGRLGGDGLGACHDGPRVRAESGHCPGHARAGGRVGHGERDLPRGDLEHDRPRPPARPPRRDRAGELLGRATPRQPGVRRRRELRRRPRLDRVRRRPLCRRRRGGRAALADLPAPTTPASAWRALPSDPRRHEVAGRARAIATPPTAGMMSGSNG